MRKGLKRASYTSETGFTIVELLIVVVVIAILAAITVVAYNGIQNSARYSAASQSLNQAQRKVSLWSVQNGDTLPASLVAADPTLSTGWEYRRFDNNTQYCLSTTVSNVSYFVRSTQAGQYQEGSCADIASIQGTSAPLAYNVTPGSSSAFSSVSGLYDITLYVVFDVIDLSTGWASIARLQPSSATNLIQFDTGDIGSNSLRYRIDTPAAANASASKAARTPGRHIGWLQLRSGMTVREFNYDDAAVFNSSSLSPGAGLSFSSLNLSSPNSSTTPISTVAYTAAHDQQTRARVMQWLASTHSVPATF